MIAVLRSRGVRIATLLSALAAALAVYAGVAWADSYWNVYQGNLPDSGGARSAFNTYAGGGQPWTIRMSWTVDSHDMHFLLIGNDGSWHGFDTDAWGSPYQPGSNYDLVFLYDPGYVVSGVAKAGCQNPSGESTVYVNCRDALTD